MLCPVSQAVVTRRGSEGQEQRCWRPGWLQFLCRAVCHSPGSGSCSSPPCQSRSGSGNTSGRKQWSSRLLYSECTGRLVVSSLRDYSGSKISDIPSHCSLFRRRHLHQIINQLFASLPLHQISLTTTTTVCFNGLTTTTTVCIRKREHARW